jgi:hypothetical protein
MKKRYLGISSLAFFFFCILSFNANSKIYPFHNQYSGSQEVPANASSAAGTIVGTYNDVTNTISYTIIFSGLSTPVTAAHFHSPAPIGINAGVVYAHTGFPTGVMSGTYSGTHVLTDAQEMQLLSGLWYSNIHTTAIPGGELRAQITFTDPAMVSPFILVYSGVQEVPPNSSTATGTIIGSYNHQSNTISYNIYFSGLSAPTTAAHFHAPAPPGANAGVVFAHPGFPVGVMSGTSSGSHVLTDAQEMQLLSGLWYSNIHTAALPGGELRAQIIIGNPNTTSTFINTYSGLLENPPNSSPATGTIIGTYNHENNLLFYSIIFNNLTTPTSFAHFHGPAAPGVNAPVVIAHSGFPDGVTSGFYSNVHKLTEEQEMQLVNGLWYSNIHTTAFPGGEIRAQILLNDIVPPVISGLTVSASELWPPNNKMRNVSVSYSSTDNFPGAVTCNLSVTSNEPVTSKTDKSSPDWIVVNNQMVQLRAERSGAGTGRVYTVTVTCTDLQGNSSSSSTTVEVKHDQSGMVRNQAAVNDLNENLRLGIAVYPNPSAHSFTIQIQDDNLSGTTDLRLYDIAGKLIESRNNISSNQTLQIGSNLKTGVYILELRQDSRIKQFRLVKSE